jgi:hypothetical protein
VQHAHACGFQLTHGFEFQRWAGAHADKQTLIAAQQLGMPITANVAFGAADAGRITSLQWLFTEEHRARWGRNFEAGIMRAAAAAGQLQACMYLHTSGCELGGVLTVTAAATHGHVELLRWLLQHCSLDPVDCATACRAFLRSIYCRRNLPILQLLLDSCELPEPRLTELLHVAGMNSELQAAQLLRQRGAQWPGVLFYERWPDNVIAWAKQQSCTAPLTQLEMHENYQRNRAAEDSMMHEW